ncbi:MAG: M28 family peptidase, partial [Armatimonadetes bacterium]|nr:M28 family peptidase [Armatimonadota bacterium]
VAIVIAAVLPGIASSAGSADYEAVARAVDLSGIKSHVNYLASLGSRVSGYPGNEKAADYILRYFRTLGLETYVQEFDLPTPLDSGCWLEVAGKRYEIASLWPNLVRTSQVPPEGLRGPLIYVGPGRLSDFDGKPVKNAIVLMDFNTGQNWLNAPLLGAAAVIFIEPASTTRGEAEVKFLRCPIDVPRFYIRTDAAAELMALTTGATPEATIHTDVKWVNRTNRNIIAIIPGRGGELAKEAVIISAYYDSISVVPRWAPGAENAVSIATLLELARVLKQHPPSRSVILLATSGHFEALTGAREFVRLWGQEPRRPRDRNKRLVELERRIRELERDKEIVDREIARLNQKEERMKAKGMELPPDERVIHVGQLEISPVQGLERKRRDDADI